MTLLDFLSKYRETVDRAFDTIFPLPIMFLGMVMFFAHCARVPVRLPFIVSGMVVALASSFAIPWQELLGAVLFLIAANLLLRGIVLPRGMKNESVQLTAKD